MASKKARDELRDLVATSCRIIGLLELSNPTRGHVSARVPGEERCLIRAGGPNEIGLGLLAALVVGLFDQMLHIIWPESLIGMWLFGDGQSINRPNSINLMG